MKYKITLAIREVWSYDYEIEAEDREQAKDKAWTNHFYAEQANIDDGKCEVREEVIHQIKELEEV
jgi:hypothetical protein